MGRIIKASLAGPDDPIFRTGLKFSPVRNGPLPTGRSNKSPGMQRNSSNESDVVRIARALDYAARKHASQRRKGEAQEPYINHLAEVALLVAEASGGSDADLVIAAYLHDTIEDQGVRSEELAAAFGADVVGLVTEVTDDKSLPKEKRKELQIAHAAQASPRAKMLKIADKVSNLRSILASPPADWSLARKQAYFDWAARVVANCRGVSPWLETRFDKAFSCRDELASAGAGSSGEPGQEENDS